jgi:hypothetical protein
MCFEEKQGHAKLFHTSPGFSRACACRCGLVLGPLSAARWYQLGSLLRAWVCLAGPCLQRTALTWKSMASRRPSPMRWPPSSAKSQTAHYRGSQLSFLRERGPQARHHLMGHRPVRQQAASCRKMLRLSRLLMERRGMRSETPEQIMCADRVICQGTHGSLSQGCISDRVSNPCGARAHTRRDGVFRQ